MRASIQQMLTVTDAIKVAASAGFTITRPTVLKYFKQNGAVMVAGRFHLDRQVFEKMWEENKDGTEQSPGEGNEQGQGSGGDR